MRRLIRGVFKLAFLIGIGYVVYKAIAGDAASREAAPRPSPPTRGLGGPAPQPARTPVETRSRAGTKPAGADRPASAPSQPLPGPGNGSAGDQQPGAGPPRGNTPNGKPPNVRSIGVGEVPPDVPKWVDPNEDGTCPPTHPVKAKVERGIFHVPGGQFYERTKADRCYRDASSAEADGLRQSKA